MSIEQRHLPEHGPLRQPAETAATILTRNPDANFDRTVGDEEHGVTGVALVAYKLVIGISAFYEVAGKHYSLLLVQTERLRDLDRRPAMGIDDVLTEPIMFDRLTADEVEDDLDPIRNVRLLLFGGKMHDRGTELLSRRWPSRMLHKFLRSCTPFGLCSRKAHSSEEAPRSAPVKATGAPKSSVGLDCSSQPIS